MFLVSENGAERIENYGGRYQPYLPARTPLISRDSLESISGGTMEYFLEVRFIY